MPGRDAGACGRRTTPLLAALGFDPVRLDALVRAHRHGAGGAAGALLELELEGQVARLPGGLFQRIAPADAGAPNRQRARRLAAAVLGYIGSMFEVLVFVYENYWRGDACPDTQQLGRKLSAHGFEPDEIHDALVWLDGLAAQRGTSPAADAARRAARPTHARVFDGRAGPPGRECLGFISFLESSGVLPAADARDRDRPRHGRRRRAGALDD